MWNAEIYQTLKHILQTCLQQIFHDYFNIFFRQWEFSLKNDQFLQHFESYRNCNISHNSCCKLFFSNHAALLLTFLNGDVQDIIEAITRPRVSHVIRSSYLHRYYKSIRGWLSLCIQMSDIILKKRTKYEKENSSKWEDVNN